MATWPIHALYGVPIQDVIKNGTLDEMKAFHTVSSYQLKGVSTADDDPSLADWKAAHADLEDAISKAGG